MFGFSRRRLKHSRLKVQLSDPGQGSRSPSRRTKRGEGVAPTTGNSDDHDCQCSSSTSDTSNPTPGSSESWMELSIAGDKPAPRFNHAAAVVGTEMVVVGGESVSGTLDDVQVLDFDKFSWTAASSNVNLSPSSLPLKIPACKGHSLVSWGNKALLIGGKTEPRNAKISVWAFDTETKCWSLKEAKGDIPVARSGHSVVIVGNHLLLFGGEDSKRRKLNDLYMIELKSMTWLPLHCTGTRPSPRSNHVAAIYDDRTMFVFGGSSKSKTLNDLYSLDFKMMVWSRIKIQGFHPSPRAGSCGVLCGTKWYIVGGGSRKKRHTDSVVFDVIKHEWSVAFISPPYSITTHRGFSLVLVQHKERGFLIAFGGCKKDPSNQVEVLVLETNERPLADQVTGKSSCSKHTSSNSLASQLTIATPCHADSATRQNLASVTDEHTSTRESMSKFVLGDSNTPSGSVSLRKQQNLEDPKTSVDDSSFIQSLKDYKLSDTRSLSSSSGKVITEVIPSTSKLENTGSDKLAPEDDANLSEIGDIFPSPSTISQLYATKVATLTRKSGSLEEQLAAALLDQETADSNMFSVRKSKQELKKKAYDAMKDLESLKEKVACLELAQEEANIVHSDNLRLEHDVAFLKAVLDNTQKELISARGMLTSERARAFQLQVEVFHLNQRLKSLEIRSPTSTKPF